MFNSQLLTWHEFQVACPEASRLADMYPTSYQARMWHKTNLKMEPGMNQDSCTAGPKNNWGPLDAKQ